MDVQITASGGDGVVAFGHDFDNAAGDVHIIFGIDSGLDLIVIARDAAAVGVEAAAAYADGAIAVNGIVMLGAEDHLSAGDVKPVADAQGLALRARGICHQLAAADVQGVGFDGVLAVLVCDVQLAPVGNIQGAVDVHRLRICLMLNVHHGSSPDVDVVSGVDGEAMAGIDVDGAALKVDVAHGGHGRHVFFARVYQIERAATSERQSAPGHDDAAHLIIAAEFHESGRGDFVEDYGADHSAVELQGVAARVVGDIAVAEHVSGVVARDLGVADKNAVFCHIGHRPDGQERYAEDEGQEQDRQLFSHEFTSIRVVWCGYLSAAK